MLQYSVYFELVTRKSARVKVAEFSYPFCSKALAAESRAVSFGQGSRAVRTDALVDLDSGSRRNRFSSESAQSDSTKFGSRSKRALLRRTVAPHEDHEVL